MGISSNLRRVSVRRIHAKTILAYLFKINILCKLHVLGMDARNFQPTSGIWNTNINLPVESTESSESRVNGVGPAGSSHNNNIGASLETIHEGEKLRYNVALDFAVCLIQKR